MASLGDNILAMAFFIGLLHVVPPFGGQLRLRWAVLVMWAAAVLGMALLGNHGRLPLGPEPARRVVPADHARVRAGVRAGAFQPPGRQHRADRAPVALSPCCSSSFPPLPLIFALLPRNVPPFQYPPYFEPAINKLEDWTRPDEIIGSDMPWAVAWYADRQSLWIPDQLRGFHGHERLRQAARAAGRVVPDDPQPRPSHSIRASIGVNTRNGSR